MNKYTVLGGYQNGGKPGIINYCEDIIGECDTHEEALNLANKHKSAWDKIIIRTDDNPDNDEYI